MISSAQSFVAPAVPQTTHSLSSRGIPKTAVPMDVVPIINEVASSAGASSSIVVAQESWRQYVPLVVTGFVIFDILLGSPAANMIMSPMRDARTAASSSNDEGDDKAQQDASQSPPRGLGGFFGGSEPPPSPADQKKAEMVSKVQSEIEDLEAALDRMKNPTQDELQAKRMSRMQGEMKRMDGVMDKRQQEYDAYVREKRQERESQK
uniref:Uncharacterized protein n=1 Tax=Grammatophora oceanica TaxID=210454 RepID=A0A7S1V302_9STRA